MPQSGQLLSPARLAKLINNEVTSTVTCHLPAKLVTSTPWECLCVDLIGPYVIKGKDGSQIDFMALTMIDPASSLFEIVELPLVRRLRMTNVNGKELLQSEDIFDKSSDRVEKLVNKTWYSRYPRCQYMIDVFLDNAAWAIRSTYHTVLKASPGAAIFGRDMLFDIPFVADWYKIGEHRQLLTDRSNERENKRRIDYDYKVGDKVLVIKDGILRKSESKYGKEPWTITTVHTNGTIRVQCGTKSERINIRRVTPYTED